ncbi:MAG: universal stress protein [Chloroflexi bacterium]|nr:universal stress protein [Chloroflexota bacterium]
MPWKKLLLPVHGDDADAKALQLACDLVKDAKGKVYLVYVIEVPHHLPLDSDVSPESSRGETVLRQMEDMAKEYKGVVEASMLQARDAGPAIVLEAVERQADLILMTVPYQTRHGSFTLGNAAPHVLRFAPCPVLIWRTGMTPSLNGARE